MSPIKLSNPWSKRLFASIGIASVVYGCLYFMHSSLTKPLVEGLDIDIVAVSGAVLSLAGAIFGYVLTIKSPTKDISKISLIVFLIFALTTAYSVQQSGGVSSPFIAFWGLTVLISPIFGAYGWVPTLAMTGSYVAGSYLNGELNLGTSIAVSLSSILPLGLGLYIFREQSNHTDQTGNNVKHLASQLSEVSTKSEIIINAIGDGVIAIDAKGTIQLINPAAQMILGWGKQDALLLNYKSVLHLTDEQNNDIPEQQNPVQQVLNTTQQAHANKLVATTKSGQKVSISLTASPIDAAGSGAIIIFRDVTKERAEEREQAEFISTASHEMRTPVASIEGYLGLAINPNTATIDQRAFDFIKKAQDSAQHLGRLFQDLLDVSKSEDGRMTSQPEVTDLTPFVQSLSEGLSQKAKEKGLELIFNPLQTSAQRKLMPVYYVNQDPSHMREIIDNLIENAIKYTPSGSVTVDITGGEDTVVVSVKDTGLGIPAEDLSHLFQKFYRVDSNDRQDIGGTGLGLYLARRLAESMNGRIWAESTYQEGSTFFLELPRIGTQEAEALRQEQANRATQTTMQQPPAQVTQIPVQTVQQITQPATQPNTTPVAQPTSPPAATPVAIPQPQPAAQPATQTAPSPQAAPVAPATPSPQPIQAPQNTPTPQPTPTRVQPATTVPRGESLTREQIAERVRQLELLSQEQRQQSVGRQQ